MKSKRPVVESTATRTEGNVQASAANRVLAETNCRGSCLKRGMAPLGNRKDIKCDQ